MRSQSLHALFRLLLQRSLLYLNLGKAHLLVLNGCLCPRGLSEQEWSAADDLFVPKVKRADESAVEAVILQLAQEQVVSVLHHD